MVGFAEPVTHLQSVQIYGCGLTVNLSSLALDLWITTHGQPCDNVTVCRVQSGQDSFVNGQKLIRCGTSIVSLHRDTNQCRFAAISSCVCHNGLVQCVNG